VSNQVNTAQGKSLAGQYIRAFSATLSIADKYFCCRRSAAPSKPASLAATAQGTSGFKPGFNLPGPASDGAALLNPRTQQAVARFMLDQTCDQLDRLARASGLRLHTLR
jgi:hypothetical protein